MLQNSWQKLWEKIEHILSSINLHKMLIRMRFTRTRAWSARKRRLITERGLFAIQFSKNNCWFCLCIKIFDNQNDNIYEIYNKKSRKYNTALLENQFWSRDRDRNNVLNNLSCPLFDDGTICYNTIQNKFWVVSEASYPWSLVIIILF